MPTNIDSRFEYSPWVEYFYSPPSLGPPSTIYKNWETSKRIRVENAKQSRPLPDDLIANQTALPAQYTSITTACRSYSVTKVPTTGGYFYEKLHFRNIFSTSPYNHWFPDDNRWAQKFREQVEAKTINLGESIAEFDQSIHMFGSLRKSIVRGFKSLLRSRKWSRFHLRDIPASVLQYNFGVAPLVSDLYDVVETLWTKAQLPVYQRIEGYMPQTADGTFDFSNWRLDWSAKRTQKWAIYVELDLDELGPISWGNPLEWIWERIPFSFVVDWAIPIGNWIGALDALRGVKQIHGTVTTRDRFGGKFRINSPNEFQVSPGFTDYRLHKRDLVNLATIPLPSFPEFNFKPSNRKLLNAVSLLGVLSSFGRISKPIRYFHTIPGFSRIR